MASPPLETILYKEGERDSNNNGCKRTLANADGLAHVERNIGRAGSRRDDGAICAIGWQWVSAEQS